jgi:hypothetical protein
VRYCAPENLEIPGLVLSHHPGMTKPEFVALLATTAEKSK